MNTTQITTSGGLAASPSRTRSRAALADVLLSRRGSPPGATSPRVAFSATPAAPSLRAVRNVIYEAEASKRASSCRTDGGEQDAVRRAAAGTPERQPSAAVAPAATSDGHVPLGTLTSVAAAREVLRRIAALVARPAASATTSMAPVVSPSEQLLGGSSAVVVPPSFVATASDFALDCRGLDVQVSDFVPVTFALERAVPVHSVDVRGAVLTPAHIRLLLDVVRHNRSPIRSILFDSATQSRLPDWCNRIGAVCRSNLRLVEKRSPSPAPEPTQAPAGAGSASEPHQAREAASVAASQRRSFFTSEKDARAKVQGRERAEWRELRATFRSALMSAVDATKQQSRRRQQQGARRSIDEEESRQRGRVEDAAATHLSGLLLQLESHRSAVIVTEEDLDRRTIWRRLCASWTSATLGHRTNVARDYNERLQLGIAERSERCDLEREFHRERIDLNGQHLDQAETIRRQVAVKVQQDEERKRRIAAQSSGTAASGHEDDRKKRLEQQRHAQKMEHLRQRLVVLEQEESRRRLSVTHPSDGEYALLMRLLRSAHAAIKAADTACRDRALVAERLERILSEKPQVRVFVPQDAPLPALEPVGADTDARTKKRIIDAFSPVQAFVGYTPLWPSAARAHCDAWRSFCGAQDTGLTTLFADVEAAIERHATWTGPAAGRSPPGQGGTAFDAPPASTNDLEASTSNSEATPQRAAPPAPLVDDVRSTLDALRSRLAHLQPINNAVSEGWIPRCAGDDGESSSTASALLRLDKWVLEHRMVPATWRISVLCDVHDAVRVESSEVPPADAAKDQWVFDAPVTDDVWQLLDPLARHPVASIEPGTRSHWRQASCHGTFAAFSPDSPGATIQNALSAIILVATTPYSASSRPADGRPPLRHAVVVLSATFKQPPGEGHHTTSAVADVPFLLWPEMVGAESVATLTNGGGEEAAMYNTAVQTKKREWLPLFGAAVASVAVEVPPVVRRRPSPWCAESIDCLRLEEAAFVRSGAPTGPSAVLREVLDRRHFGCELHYSHVMTLSNVVVSVTGVPCDAADEVALVPGQYGGDLFVPTAATHVTSPGGVVVARVIVGSVSGTNNAAVSASERRLPRAVKHRLEFQVAVTPAVLSRVMAMYAFRNASACPLLGPRRFVFAVTMNDGDPRRPPVTVYGTRRVVVNAPEAPTSWYFGPAAVTYRSVLPTTGAPGASEANDLNASGEAPTSPTSASEPTQLTRAPLVTTPDDAELCRMLRLARLDPFRLKLAPVCALDDPDTEYFAGGILKVILDPIHSVESDEVYFDLPLHEDLVRRLEGRDFTSAAVATGMHLRRLAAGPDDQYTFHDNGVDVPLAAVVYERRPIRAAVAAGLGGGDPPLDRVVGLTVTFATSGDMSVDRLQRLLRTVCYRNWDYRLPLGASMVDVTLTIGQTVKRFDVSGKEITDASDANVPPSAPLRQRIVVQRRPCLFTAAAATPATTRPPPHSSTSVSAAGADGGAPPSIVHNIMYEEATAPKPLLPWAVTSIGDLVVEGDYEGAVIQASIVDGVEIPDALVVDLPDRPYHVIPVAAEDALRNGSVPRLPSAGGGSGDDCWAPCCTLANRLDHWKDAFHRRGLEPTAARDGLLATGDLKVFSVVLDAVVAAAASPLSAAGGPSSLAVPRGAGRRASSIVSTHIATCVLQREGPLSIVLHAGGSSQATAATSTTVSRFLRCLKFSNVDRDPRVLSGKRAVVTLRCAEGVSAVFCRVTIAPFDDPTEIVTQRPNLIYRSRATEREPYSKAIARMLMRNRERMVSRDSTGAQIIGIQQDRSLLCPEVSRTVINALSNASNPGDPASPTAMPPQAAGGPAIAAWGGGCPPRLNGSLLLLNPAVTTVSDPDTYSWDGGTVTVTATGVVSRFVQQWRLRFLLHEGQEVVRSSCPGLVPSENVTLACDMTTHVLSAQVGDRALVKIADIDFYDGSGAISPIGTLPAEGCGGAVNQSDPAAPANDASPPEEPAAAATATGPSVTFPVLRVRFASLPHPQDPDVDPPLIPRAVLTAVLNSLCFEETMAVPQSETKISFRIEVRDVRNPTPGIVAVSVEHLPPALRLHGGWSAPPDNPQAPHPAPDVACVLPTRAIASSSGSNVSGEPIFPFITVVSNDKDNKLQPGGFLEVFIASGASPRDVLHLKFQGSPFVLTSDSQILSGRDGPVGKLFVLPHALRIEVREVSKAATMKRLQMLLRCVHFKCDTDAREPHVPMGDRTVHIAVSDGRIDAFGRLEVSHIACSVSVQELPFKRD